METSEVATSWDQWGTPDHSQFEDWYWSTYSPAYTQQQMDGSQDIYAIGFEKSKGRGQDSKG